MTKILVEKTIIDQALEALEYETSSHKSYNRKPLLSSLEAITAMREALGYCIDEGCPHHGTTHECTNPLAEQAEQEPVAWARTSESGEVLDCISNKYKVTQPCTVDYDEPLYAAPVQQAEQEPVASVRWGRYKECEWTATERLHELLGRYREGQTPLQLYAAPVRTKDLTYEEIGVVMRECKWMNMDYFARAVIAADRKKNNV